MNYMYQYNRWLSEAKVTKEEKEELLSIKDSDDEIKLRFINYLEFGTAGLRGVMVAGTNAMNNHTVAHATQGFADYILSVHEEERGVVIAHDSRINSRIFAEITASVFAANGIKTYIFDSLRPTPVLSFAIRHLGCAAGVNITASHNPKEYNGYKAYWDDGAQLSLEQADAVFAYIKATDIFNGVKTVDYNEAVASGKITVVGPEIDDAYVQNVTAQLVDPSIIRKMADELKIVYTPLHGCGYRLVPEVLRLCGVKHLFCVADQMILDGSFPTVASPNPENSEALDLGEALAEKVGSDLVIATDPDADRTGIKARRKDGSFATMTGNQVGALLLDYILTAYENTNTMPEGAYAVKTIVSTEMVTRICKEHGVDLHNVLTGFKFIGEVIKNHDDIGIGNFLLGFEESYGYLKGTYARDKDAVVAVMLITEMAAYYKSKNMTLSDALELLYEKYGYYGEKTLNVYMKGVDGADRMKALLERIRNNPPAEIGGMKVISVRDYLKGTITDLESGEVSPTNLPISNVLYFETAGAVGGNVLIFRPSGTEPKIKIYLLANGKDKAELDSVLSAMQKSSDELIG
ncbi:MAG: phospho-sugar mutase [Clostridia bacterium]|nr:phospho-sugar mutase [Clostridia bacterium]